MNKKDLSKQISNAFEFIQKLYHESSFLIKEIEGQLAESDHRFKILKKKGYGINSVSSTSLDASNIKSWLLRKFSVVFAEEENTTSKNGVTLTTINYDLKVVYVRIILNDKDENSPQLVFGVLYDIEVKDHKKFDKLEQLMGQFESLDNKMFSKFPNIDYKGSIFSLKGKLKKVDLLDINSSEELVNKVINPVIKMYEEM